MDVQTLLFMGLAVGVVLMTTGTDSKQRVHQVCRNKTPLCLELLEVRSWVNCRLGLLNHLALPVGSGILLQKTRTIHTIGMMFPIDVIFLDRNGVILSILAGVQSGRRRVPGPPGTKSVIEIRALSAQSLGLSKGDYLSFEREHS